MNILRNQTGRNTTAEMCGMSITQIKNLLLHN